MLDLQFLLRCRCGWVRAWDFRGESNLRLLTAASLVVVTGDRGPGVSIDDDPCVTAGRDSDQATVLAVVGPPAGGLVGLGRQQCREVHVLSADRAHLRVYQLGDLVQHQAFRQSLTQRRDRAPPARRVLGGGGPPRRLVEVEVASGAAQEHLVGH